MKCDVMLSLMGNWLISMLILIHTLYCPLTKRYEWEKYFFCFSIKKYFISLCKKIQRNKNSPSFKLNCLNLFWKLNYNITAYANKIFISRNMETGHKIIIKIEKEIAKDVWQFSSLIFSIAVVIKFEAVLLSVSIEWVIPILEKLLLPEKT